MDGAGKRYLVCVCVCVRVRATVTPSMAEP